MAAEGFTDVSRELDDLRRDIRSAEVYLIARDQSFRYTYGESDVLRSGCRYAVTSASDLGSLIDVLANAELVQVPARKDEYDARIVIRLHRADSRVHAVVLGPDYANANSNGEYRVAANATSSVVPVAATKHGIESGLRLWAAQHQSLAAKRCSD